MTAEIQIPTGQLVVGQPLDHGIYPETIERFPLQILRECSTKPVHGFSPKGVTEVWAPDRGSLTLTNREVCTPHGCTKELPSLYLSLADIERISTALGNYVEEEGSKPPKSIQF